MRTYSSADVNVPVHQAYDAWARLDRFPDYFPDLDHAERVGDDSVRLTGPHGSWVVRFEEEVRPRILKWRDTPGQHMGTVRFYQRADGSTKVVLQLCDERLGDPRLILAHFRDVVQDASPLLVA